MSRDTTKGTPTNIPSRADFVGSLAEVCGAGSVRSRLIDRKAMAHDASHYLLTPLAVVEPRSADEVASILRTATRHQVPVTFRSGGTSLSGQAGTDGLLVDTRRHFRGAEVLDEGARVRVQPGVTVRTVNARLARYGVKLGPDPASEAACTMGGVIANNSSGMECGTALNTFHTLESMRVVLASGTLVDTGAPDADAQLRATEPRLYEGLITLRKRILDNPRSRAKIAQQYSMKNTMGYSLNAFTEFSTVPEILAHLLVGSEGTLGWVHDATFRTVPVRPEAATAFLVFPNVMVATQALRPLLDAGARTLELLDAASLRVSQVNPAADETLRSLRVAQHTALLVELQADDRDELDDALAATDRVLPDLGLSLPASFTTVPAARANMWQLRKGLYTAVAGARPVGTTALLEDVVVPLAELPAATHELAGVLQDHGYDDAVIFGHAKDGNLHFMINPRLDVPSERERYEDFTADLVDLVLGHDGSLKAEHGTGRVMAPFVERQFGSELYDIMRRVKDLLDPGHVLNPGVVLSDNTREHLENLKIVPPVDDAVDACVECGYCEPVCPSRDLTTTPRQRIALMRELAQAGPAEHAELVAAFSYDAVDTCAADSLCVTACPVFIDTGKVMKGYREQRHSERTQRAGAVVARHFGTAVTGARAALTVADKLPAGVLQKGSRSARRIAGSEWMPEVGEDLPRAGRRRRPRGTATADVVYFPACVGSIFGGPRRDGAADAFTDLCATAGLAMRIPEGINGLCCGTPWQSKGLTQGLSEMRRLSSAALWDASEGGAVPIVCDASSCTHGLQQISHALDEADVEALKALTILDSVTFVRREILPRVRIDDKLDSLVLHPTCSNVHLGSVDDLIAVAEACAVEVVVPTRWGCCGFAGDRGLLHPELTTAATAPEAAEINERVYDAYASANRTCEMGMSRATGQDFQHVLTLLAERARRR